MSDGDVNVQKLDFEALQPIDWAYIYGLGSIPDQGAAAFVDEDSHHFTVHQAFANGHSVDFVFTGKDFKYLGNFPVTGTIKHLEIRVDGHDAYDFSHFKIGVVAAFKLFEKPQTAIVKTLFSDNNWVVGSPFADTTLAGFKGDDRFVFKYAPTGTNIDTIIDFRHNHNFIYLDNPFFDGLGTHGHLKSSNFVKGTEANAPHPQAIYDPIEGKWYLDPDGNGPENPIPVAILLNHGHPANFSAHDVLLG